MEIKSWFSVCKYSHMHYSVQKTFSSKVGFRIIEKIHAFFPCVLFCFLPFLFMLFLLFFFFFLHFPVVSRILNLRLTQIIDLKLGVDHVSDYVYPMTHSNSKREKLKGGFSLLHALDNRPSGKALDSANLRLWRETKAYKSVLSTHRYNNSPPDIQWGKEKGIQSIGTLRNTPWFAHTHSIHLSPTLMT